MSRGVSVRRQTLERLDHMVDAGSPFRIQQYRIVRQTVVVRVDLNRIAEEIRRDEGNARIEIVEEDAIEAEIRLREHLISATSRATSPSDGFLAAHCSPKNYPHLVPQPPISLRILRAVSFH